jgi:hypothetical protein
VPLIEQRFRRVLPVVGLETDHLPGNGAGVRLDLGGMFEVWKSSTPRFQGWGGTVRDVKERQSVVKPYQSST